MGTDGDGREQRKKEKKKLDSNDGVRRKEGKEKAQPALNVEPDEGNSWE